MGPEQCKVRYRLNRETIAVAVEDGQVFHVPARATVTVLGSLTESDAPNRQVKAQWLGKAITMFAVDILERGEKV